MPARAPIRPLVHLLPIYDEYTVAYRDRLAVPHGPARVRTPSAMITFRHTLVIDGLIAGTWRTTKSPSGLRVCVTALRPLTSRERAATARAVDRYATFLGAQLQLSIE